MTEIVTSWERLATVKMVTKVLDARFGPLSAAITAQIADYPHELLEALILAQVKFTALADLESWLTANPVPPWVDPLAESDEDEALSQ